MSNANSTELQNLLIEKLLNQNSPSKSTGEPSSFGTFGIIILVTVLLIIGGVIIYFIFIANLVPPYPLSPFKDGQTVVIRPAILCDVPGNIENQYLSQVIPLNTYYSYPDGVGVAMGVGATALQFIGNKNDATSQWVLEQKNAAGTLDSNQSLQAGLGNRFFLRAKNSSQSDLAGRVRYQVATQLNYALCPSVTPAVIGSNNNDRNWYETELIIYFYPTNYKDIYYLLFPNCTPAPLPNGTFNQNTTTSPNNGLVTIRPWSTYIPPSFFNHYQLTPTNCTLYEEHPPSNCNPSNENFFVPYTTSTPADGINNNVMLMNYLSSENLLPPYPNPNVTLFKVTLA